jgi:5-(carboxyamino)imidazole ribonucleotide synthase
MPATTDIVKRDESPHPTQSSSGGAMKVGIVGAGQLARMMLEEASALGIDATVLAESSEDGAAKVCADVILGAATDEEAIRSLAGLVDVITLDHELVDLDLMKTLETEGVIIRPPSAALECAVDKSIMRRRLGAAGLPMPLHEIIEPGGVIDIEALGSSLGWPLVIKSATGGYDGRGVFVVTSPDEAATTIEQLHSAGITALIEEAVDIDHELAALIARRPDGEMVAWPVVETAQVAGVCREVLIPGILDPAVAAEAAELARTIAESVGVVGVMAVELFATPEGLVINELAMRPHNSGHWTQDGSVTSQFANHLRAVLDLPLGATDTIAAAVASVNVFGGAESTDLDTALVGALSVTGAHVHLYGKSPRPGRKLGHVTAVGENGEEVRKRAWSAAVALGTPVPSEMEDVVE